MVEVKYTIIKEHDAEIIVREFEGIVELGDILESLSFIEKSMMSESVVGIITDGLKANLKLKISDVEEIIQFMQNSERLKKLKFAALVNTPENTIFPTTAHFKSEMIAIRPFTTKEAALQWILKF